MKSLFLLLTLAFLVFQLKANTNPEEGPVLCVSPENATALTGKINLKMHVNGRILCRAIGGHCRRSCRNHEISGGKCLSEVHCCVGYDLV
uniref:Beta-defensin-like protein 21 n=1 Tax=Anolis carolinensis TaxID=28377 RepID=G7ZL99_ANOCA|nr:PREDICTED: uncharacterized protein bd21 [Anolis carolinensis]CBY85062.1 beta-defensin-like protein 21 [Anolis carolinensis]|eukprot:XP_008116132.1 PREDICTED: uncharacterized protein bd21 [Anolis carolinensis]